MGRTAAVLVDFDDTLIDNSVVPVAVERACEAIAAAVEGIDATSLLRANSASWAARWPLFERRCWLGELEVFDVSRDTWRQALLDCGCHDDDAVDLAVHTHHRISQEMDRAYDDVPGFLDAVRSAGLLVALVTNSSSRSQRSRLAATGLDRAFDHIVISGEVGIAKPDKAIFHAALDHLGVSAASAWHIGDSLSTDVAGAASAGLRSVWLNRNNRSRNVDNPIPDASAVTLDGLVDRLVQP
jgi:putative hydrolase of the HAD superfamily